MGSPSARTPFPALRRRFGPFAARVVLGAAAALAALPAPVRAGPPELLRFSVQDPDGNFFPQGEVEFCLHGGGCLYADIDRGYPGQFSVPSAKLVPDGLYQVIVYDPGVDVVYEMRDWRYAPADFDVGHDARLDIGKFDVFARFRGKAGGGLDFAIARTLNPEWERRAGLAPAGPDSLPDFPRLAGRITVPFMFGAHYGDAPEAAGGVLAVDPGLGLALAWRSRYRQAPATSGSWRSFREFTLAWDGNRYTTESVLTPGRDGDVVFHRLTAAYGLGRLSPGGNWQLSLSLVAGAGAVLDGTEALRWRDREYVMFGAGARLVAIREVAAGRGVRMGLCGVVEALNWWAEPVGDDHWYGLAPSAALGLAFY